MAEKKIINTELQPIDKLLDSSGDAGTSGQILSSTGSGTNWINAGGGTITGSGNQNYIPLWSSGTVLTNSIITSSGGDITINGSDNDPRIYINPAGGDIGDTALIQFNSRGIVGYTGGLIELGDNNQSKDVRLRVNTADIIFQTSNTTRMTIKTDGKVGIGTSSPGSPLHIAGTSGSVAGSAILFNGSTAIWQPSDAKLTIRPSGTDAATFTSTGVGIGTASPTYKLHVVSADASDDVAYIHHDNASQSSGTVLKIRTDAGDSNGYALLDVQTNTGSALFVRGDRNTGIKTSSPIHPLYVNGDIGQADGFRIWFRGSSSSSGVGSQSYVYSDGLNLKIKGDDNVRILGDGGSTIAHFDYSGKVGIGTLAPSELLQVAGNIRASSGYKVGATQVISSGLRFFAADGSNSAPTYSFTGRTDTGMFAEAHGSNDRIQFTIDGTARGYIDANGIASHSNIYFGSGSSLRNYSGVWAATTGTSGKGFTFANTADNSGAVLLNITSVASAATDSVATFSGKVKSAQTASDDDNDVLATKSYVDGLVTGVTRYMGLWDASSGTGGNPDLTASTYKVPGYYFIVSVAGSATPNGAGTEPNTWHVGDWVIWSDQATDAWQKIDNTSVLSGTGTANKLALWNGDESLTNSRFSQNATTNIITGPGTAASDKSLSVTNSGPTEQLYVMGTGEVVITQNYLYVSASQGAYINGILRARGGVSDDGGTLGLGGNGAVDNLILTSNTSATFAGTVTTNGTLTVDGDGSSSVLLKTKGSARIALENANATDSFYLSNTGGNGASVLDLGGALSLVENGNATFSGILDVNGTGTSTFAGPVSITPPSSTGWQGLTITGSGTSHTQGAIVIKSSTSDTPEARGQGIFMFNEGDDSTWYTGTQYQDADTWMLGRVAGTSLDTSAATSAKAALEIYNSKNASFKGDVTIAKSTPKLTFNNLAGGGLDPMLTASGTNFTISTTSITPLTIALDTGAATFQNDVQAAGIYVGATNTSYDLYNNGTTYLNGATIIDANLNITAGALSITADGSNAVTLTESGSGDFTIDAPDDIRLDAGGGDIVLRDDGTEYGRLTNDSTNLEIKSSVNDKDIIFKGVDNTSEITALTLDMSDAGKATFNNGWSSDGEATEYTWRVPNTSSNDGHWYKIARVTSSQSTRFKLQMVGGHSYSDGYYSSEVNAYGQLNNDNNYDLIFHRLEADNQGGNPIISFGQVDVNNDSTDLYVRLNTFAELVITASISNGDLYPDDTSTGSSTTPTNFAAALEQFGVLSPTIFQSTVRLDSQLLDGTNDAGTSGQILSSTGNVTNWVDASAVIGGPYLPLTAGSSNKLTGDLYIEDNERAIFGDGSDLQIYHNAVQNNGIIQDSSGNGLDIYATTDVKISSGAIGETYAIFTKDGPIELYYDNSKKFETTTSGIDVSGQVSINDYLVHNGDTNTYLGYNGADSFELVVGGTQKITADSNAAYLRYQGSTKLETTSTGITITGSITLDDYIYHSGDTNTFFKFNSGGWEIQSSGGPTTDISATGGVTSIYGKGVVAISCGTGQVSTFAGDISPGSNKVLDRNIPCLFNSNFLDNYGTSIYVIPFNDLTEATVSTRTYYHNLTMPYAGKLTKVVMKNVSGSPSSGFTTQLFFYVNGSMQTSSSELTISSDKIEWSPTSSNTFSAGDELSFGYQKSSTKTWGGVSIGIAIELTDYDI